MKKLIFLGLFGALLVFLFMSCPDKNDHKERLGGAITELIGEKLHSEAIEDFLTQSTEFQSLLSTLGTAAVDVDNYFLFSIGKIDLIGEEQVVSFGIGGHVFTFNDDIVKQVGGTIQDITEKFK